MSGLHCRHCRSSNMVVDDFGPTFCGDCKEWDRPKLPEAVKSGDPFFVGLCCGVFLGLVLPLLAEALLAR